MRTNKNNWLLAAAVSAALSGYAGVSSAVPALLELNSVVDTISLANDAPNAKVKLWVLDANGNITSNDMDHTVTLTSSDQNVIASTILNFPAGESYIETLIGNGGDITLGGSGSTQLSAAFAESGSTNISTNATSLPMKVVTDFMKVKNIMTNPVVAGTEVPAFKVTNADNQALEGQILTVIHYDAGSSNPPAEVIGGLASGLTPTTAGLGGAVGQFPTVDASGNVNLTFFTASANPTTTSEYYIIKDLTGKYADVRVDNIGSDDKADIVPAAASSVLYIKNGQVLNSFAVPTDPNGGFKGPLPTLTIVDDFGNSITALDTTANIFLNSPAGGILGADQMIKYTNLTSDDLTLDFTSPPTTLQLKAVAEDSQAVMTGPNCLSLNISGTLASMTANSLPSDAQFVGGISSNNSTVVQQDIIAGINDQLTAQFTVTAGAIADANYSMLAFYKPPVPNAPLFALTLEAGANRSGIGKIGLWDYNTNSIVAYNNVLTTGASTMQLFTDFAFGFDLIGSWFIAPGYTSNGSYVTCASNLVIK